MENVISNMDHLITHLKVFKFKAIKTGVNKLMIYPLFCIYYSENKERYHLPHEIVIESACKILIEKE